MNEENKDLEELFSQGISLWSKPQELLEEQALKELEVFAEHHQESNANHQTLTRQNEAEINGPLEKEVFQNCPLTNHHDNESEEDTEGSGSEYVPSGGELSDEDYKTTVQDGLKKSKSTKKNTGKKNKSTKKSFLTNNSRIKDDALEFNYKARLKTYYDQLERDLESQAVTSDDEINSYKKLKGGLKVPVELWNKLYDYQRDCLKWLWEIHQRPTGGLLGDEMGLGKTVQIISFLHSLQYSKIVSKHCKFIGVGPSLIVCPATVIHQWLKHFHEWSPEFRVAILHQSGTHQGNKAKLIDEINKNKGIIIMTYAAVLKYKGNLCEYNWHYFILDEGHKIRNPSAKISVAIKEIRTPHRIMLTGSPMQNNLSELWSLFDFTNPGMLGNLATFTEHFVNPILQGGFANSTPMQEATALSVASTLKNVISPFLLRRMKKDVKDLINLPHKSEQVLFCSLTDEQRDLYKDYLMSEHVNNILNRGIKIWGSNNYIKANMLIAITALRKICNHPDLFLNEYRVDGANETPIDNNYGFYKKSGKMIVVSALLKIWKKQGHRTLLFCQGRLMLKMFELFLSEQGYTYLKMDGSTSIHSRQGLIDKFNQGGNYDVFLLTTRVGGLGINLTGANKVIIYDPDWNPATDSQARERAWRIGQEKAVTVYRLISAGTVEEKMYQRQVWKQLLSNKVLVDPTTSKFFKSSDLFDLFSLPESHQADPETANIFRDSRVKIQEKIKERRENRKTRFKKTSTSSDPSQDASSSRTFQFSDRKILEMKALAEKIAKSLSQKSESVGNEKKVHKSLSEIEFENERTKKIKEKERIKALTPQELRDYNRKKAERVNEDTINKIDDIETNISFDRALEHSYNAASSYHSLNKKSLEENNQYSSSKIESLPLSKKTECEKEEKVQESKKRKRKDCPVDTSGKIDGEEVEGLIKREKKKLKYERTSSNDDYILTHLFSKKGVSGILEHESVLNGGKKQQSLKVRTCAEEKALKSLDALKQSRINNWRW